MQSSLRSRVTGVEIKYVFKSRNEALFPLKLGTRYIWQRCPLKHALENLSQRNLSPLWFIPPKSINVTRPNPDPMRMFTPPSHNQNIIMIPLFLKIIPTKRQLTSL